MKEFLVLILLLVVSPNSSMLTNICWLTYHPNSKLTLVTNNMKEVTLDQCLSFYRNKNMESLSRIGKVCLRYRKLGFCSGEFKRWFFNKTTQNCEEYIQTGCCESGNSFMSQTHCEDVCFVQEF